MEINDLKAPETGGLLRSLDAELWVVIAFPIIPEALLDIPQKGIVNLHASLLPSYRGAAPVQWAIINGESVTGLTTFFIDAGVDTGRICLQREVEILPDENAGELSERLSEIGALLVVETVESVERGNAPGIAQDPSMATPAPKLSKSDGELNWDMPATDLVNRIRGLNPWPGSYTFLGEERILVLRARKVEESGIPWQIADAPLPGTIGGFLEDQTPVVAAGDGLGVALLNLQREGRKSGSGADVMRGLHCKGGERFRVKG